MHTVTTAWPSVTGVAYAPMLMGRHPGHVGLPGLRWFDRSRRITGLLGHSRSYLGSEMRMLDAELAPESPTLFELVHPSLGALSVIKRGLPIEHRIGVGLSFALRAALMHFGGDVGGWLATDQRTSETIIHRVQRSTPEFVFAAFTGIDKASHAFGHTSRQVLDGMRIVDGTAAALRAHVEARGMWEKTHLWIVSDHGHSPVAHHEDLADHFRQRGFRTLAHPWTFGRGHDVAVMVSGNAMAHIYLEPEHTARRFWGALRDRWEEEIAELLRLNAVDVLVLPTGPSSAQILGAGRGMASVAVSGSSVTYALHSGDPLGVGECNNLTMREAYDVCRDTPYPDALAQIAGLVASSRCGDVILSARPGYDFRANYEPIPHVSTHGALHREHMLVPLITSRPIARVARRTADLMPSVLSALGRPIPCGLDGEAFV